MCRGWVIVYVIGGANGTTALSTDGIIWRFRTSGFGASAINALSYSNDIFVMGGQGGTLRRASFTGLRYGYGVLNASTDSTNWSVRTIVNSGFVNMSTFTAIGSSGSIYLIAGRDTNQTSCLLASTDTFSWVLRTTGFGSTSISTIAYGNGTYIATGGGTAIYSTDTISWTLRTNGSSPGFGATTISAITFGNLFLVGGPGATLASFYGGPTVSAAGSGGAGTRGGGGGGGGLSFEGSPGPGGKGGDGYVRISWW